MSKKGFIYSNYGMRVKFNRKLGFYHWWVFDPVYRANIYMVWPCTTKIRKYYFSRYLNIKDDRPFNIFAGCTEIINDSKSASGVVIQLSEWGNTPRHIASLSHECNHATFFILSGRGVDVKEEGNNEAFCYYSEFLLYSCLKALHSKVGK